MPVTPDYRSEKSESSEGRGVALARRARWEAGLPDDVREAAWGGGVEYDPDDPYDLAHLFGGDLDKVDKFWAETAKQAKRRSDLIGFWVSWHLAGGFAALQAAGWDRATIYRKLKQFRREFGEHPDTHDFDWLTLDAAKAWMANLIADLEGEERPI